MPSSGIESAWTVPVQGTDNPQTVNTFAAGVFEGERMVAVQVPSGLHGDGVQLEIRASSSLLSTISSIASDVASGAVSDPVALAAARLSGAASVASAYNRLGYGPAGVELSSVEWSLLLQDIYSGPRPDGGWGGDEAGLAGTGQVLLAVRRQQIAGVGSGAEAVPAVDQSAISRGLAYISSEANRPLTGKETREELDERAYGLYVLSFFGQVEAAQVRSLIAYTQASDESMGLSRAGQAWLAMALLQSGSSEDAFALVDRLLLTQAGPEQTDTAAAPMLEALVAAMRATHQGRAGARDVAAYESAAASYVRSLMEVRRGTGWSSPGTTASVLWALSLYAAQTGERPIQTSPALTLHDRPVEAQGLDNAPGSVSVVLSGDSLRAGNNWLRIKAPAANQPMYYSLTLRATR
jgi:hypothetical protein